MNVTRKRPRRLYASNLIAPIVIVIMGAILAYGVSDKFQTELTARFTTDSQDTLQVAAMKLDDYGDLLYAGRAFVSSSQTITNTEWQSFYNQQAIFDRYPGVSSVAYVQAIPTAELGAFEIQMKSNDYFGPSYQLKQQSERSSHGLIRVYLSRNNMTGVIGRDLWAEQSRLDVYEAAAAEGTVIASPPFKLATGYDGFFSLLSVYKNNALDGYVLASYRFDELMRELFKDESFGYRVTDVTTDVPQQLYEARYTDGGYRSEQTVDVGGRRWKVEMRKDAEERPVGYLLPAGILATSLVLASALYLLSIRPIRASTKRK